MSNPTHQGTISTGASATVGASADQCATSWACRFLGQTATAETSPFYRGFGCAQMCSDVRKCAEQSISRYSKIHHQEMNRSKRSTLKKQWNRHHFHLFCTSVPRRKSQPSRTVASESAPEAAECNDAASWLEVASLERRRIQQVHDFKMSKRKGLKGKSDHQSFMLNGRELNIAPKALQLLAVCFYSRNKGKDFYFRRRLWNVLNFWICHEFSRPIVASPKSIKYLLKITMFWF